MPMKKLKGPVIGSFRSHNAAVGHIRKLRKSPTMRKTRLGIRTNTRGTAFNVVKVKKR